MNRRDFLKKSAVALTSAVVGGSVSTALTQVDKEVLIDKEALIMQYPVPEKDCFDGQVFMSMGAGKQPAWVDVKLAWKTFHKEPFGIIEIQSWPELDEKL